MKLQHAQRMGAKPLGGSGIAPSFYRKIAG
jgi:hypothetical protein